MDETKKNGGARAGAGRKPKADEIQLIETMDAIAVPDTIWKALADKIKDKDVNAIKTWLQYRYGMPKQIIEQTNITPVTEIVLTDAVINSNT